MRRWRWMIGCLVAVVLIHNGVALGQEKDPSDLPWKKAYLELGYYFADLDSSFRIGSGALGLGIDIDVEDFLGLNTTDSAFRVDGGWRFTDNKRHKLEFNWFRFHRDASETLSQSVDIPDGEGGITTLGPGRLESKFDFDIIKLKYEYSLFLDDRLDINVGGGLYVMPIEFGTTGTVNGVGQTTLEEDITAPLPVFGMGFDFAITPEWFIRQQFDAFYLELGDFEGSILAASLGLEYLPWKHVGFGIAGEFLDISIEARGSDWPGIDFEGRVDFGYFGARIYVKTFF